MKTRLFAKENLRDVRDKMLFSVMWFMLAIAVFTAFVNVRVSFVVTCLILIMPPILSWILALIYQVVRIKRWTDHYKSTELIEALEENRMTDVRFLVWAGADVNYKKTLEHADPWDDWRSWTYRYVHPLDVAKSEEARNFLTKRGAVPCPDTKVYCF